MKNRSPKILIALTPLATVAAAACLWQQGGMTSFTGHVEVPPPNSKPQGELVEMLGINEAISIPGRMLDENMFTENEIGERLQADARAARDVGARWVRSHTAVHPTLHWQKWKRNPNAALRQMDGWVAAAQAQGLKPILMISPWSGNHTATMTKQYLPPDATGYGTYVQQVVERYDGDGWGDAPGLRAPIHTYEIDNEPDLKNTQVPRGASRDYVASSFCTPEEYAEVLVTTARHIRAANPYATILNGGFYRPMTRTAYRYMERLFAQPGVLESFQVLSLHVYHSGTTMERFEQAIAYGRELAPGKPIWITETNVPSDKSRSEPWLNEDYQAEMVVLTYMTALQLGVEKVFWHTLHDPPGSGKRKGPGMDNHSLHRAEEDGTLTRKPAGDAYEALAEVLAQGSWSSVVSVEAEGGEVLQVGDQWLAVGDEITTSLSNVEAVRLVGATPVPVEVLGDGIRFDATEGPILLRSP